MDARRAVAAADLRAQQTAAVGEVGAAGAAAADLYAEAHGLSHVQIQHPDIARLPHCAAGTNAIAREFDPLDPMLRVHHALVAFYRRDFDRAVEALRHVLEMEPQNLVARVLSASAHLGRGAYDDALELFEQIAADVPADSIGPLGVVQAHALAGHTNEARAAFDALRERFGEAGVGPYRMAIAFSRLGGPDSAFAWLDRAAAARDLNLVCLAVDPSFDALRDDPRWKPALLRYRLPVIDPRPAGR